MKNFKTVDEILDFAIREEELAYEFYTDLAKKIDDAALQKTLTDLAKQEQGHRDKLAGIKKGKPNIPVDDRLLRLKLEPDPVNAPTGAKTLDLQDAYLLAMEKEKQAFHLYSRLADSAADPTVKEILNVIAQEEARHKLKLEVDYDEHFQQDN